MVLSPSEAALTPADVLVLAPLAVEAAALSRSGLSQSGLSQSGLSIPSSWLGQSALNRTGLTVVRVGVGPIVRAGRRPDWPAIERGR